MKRLIIFLLLFAALKVAGQTTGYLRFDTVRIMKQNGTCELYIINKTKDSVGGVLTNIGGGLTSFKKSWISGDSLFVGGDTVIFPGSSGKLDSVTIETATDPDPDTLFEWRGSTRSLVGLIPKGGGATDTTETEPPVYVKPGTHDTLAVRYDTTTITIRTTGYNDSALMVKPNGLVFDSTKFISSTIPKSRGSQMINAGNSITQGQNAVPLDSTYYNLFNKDYLNIPSINIALSGMGAFYAAQKHDSLINGYNNNSITSVMVGYNDERATSTDYRTHRKIASGIKAMILNHFAEYYIPGATTPTDTSVTRYGTFSVTLDAMRYSGKTKFAASTTTINDSIVWVSQPATMIGINLIAGDSLNFNHSIVEVFIDNVSQGEFNTNNIADGTALVGGANQRISYPIIIGGLTNVSHRVKLVNKAARIMYVDYFTALDSRKPSFIILHNINPLGGSAGAQGLGNAAIDSMVATLPSVLPVLVVPTNNYFVPATGMDGDGVHPNNTGHYQIYTGYVATWLANLGGTIGSYRFDGRNFWLCDGKTWHKITNPSDSWTKGDAAINAAGYVGVPYNMSYKQAGLDILKTDHALFNTKVGALAGTSSTTADGITAVGYQALTSATTGGANTAVGYRTMELTVTGTLNTAVGYFSARNNTGDRNTSLGYNTLFTNTSGADNTAVGASALAANTGSLNTAVGSSALIVNTTGSQNNAFGYRTMISVTTQSNNNAFGTNGLRDNTGSGNSAFGSQVMWLKGAGDNNAVFGSQGFQTVGGNTFNNNTGIGFQVGGIANTTGSNNVFVGYRAGDNLTTGSNNTLLCYDCDLLTSTTSNFTSINNLIYAIGPFATGTSISTSANVGIAINAPTARLHLPAGTTAAGTAPQKYTSGSLITTPEVGAFEFFNDIPYFTITTAAARKQFTLWDAAATIGRIPFVTTNGRLLDDAGLSWDNSTKVFQLGGTASAFPGLLRDGASIQVKLADNSGNANLKVLDQAYSESTWNGNDEVPTKNAIRDKIEVLNIVSSTYTPTFTNGANVDAVSAPGTTLYFQRIGNQITVWGNISVDATAGLSTTNFAISLPIASAMTGLYQLSGQMNSWSAGGGQGAAEADITNDRANFTFENGAATGAVTYAIRFSYEVL